ncbi:hypothetical protein HCTV-8_gp90 [Haloarcula virus HCTV-8]|uniref:Uncharacterized protein n=3 Tax=Haloferacalesvirus hv5 TaxID=1273753 RepID=A0AAE9BWC0_9CAUD|nr:hypothetical protein HCTV-7_gp92 [Haloarcula phage HCTV-7]UBF20533.1 hypothetical protein HCTV-9_gp92 [Haloarcula phage HCTV-9]UBF20649.1 hypothetical protein HCTV-11_gp92 [Haloarcula phage HCTV-11]UBF20989.1 hypothetical protein HCTV-8_gp90 [Haloarcula virus HCTV-8]UBF21101.1 hypothetical protein HCTV-10_gp90 [Haloarcula virus HCTV-10]
MAKRPTVGRRRELVIPAVDEPTRYF